MGWPYHFLDLSPDQIAERRKVLDRYGFYAWLSPIVLFSFIYAGQILLARFPSRFFAQSSNKAPSVFQLNARRLSWILDTPLQSDFGTLKVHLVVLLYTGWLLFLSVHQTGADYMHLTKRLSHIVVSQLPLQYMISIKSPLSPIQLVTGLSHETLNPYHRFGGRVLQIILDAHAILYLNFFFQVSALPRRLYDRDVQFGIAAMVVLLILSATARPIVRQNAYHKNFYVPHALLSVLLLPLIYAHVPYTRKYVYQVLALYVFNVGARKFYTTAPPSAATVTHVAGTNGALLHISVPAPKIPFGSPIPTWMPGQHVYLKSSHNPKFPRSPFTIASVPPVLPNAALREKTYRGHPLPPMEFVVRKLGGPTSAWLSSSKGASLKPAHGQDVKSGGSGSDMASPSWISTSELSPKPSHVGKLDVLIEGPYGASSVVNSLFSSISDLTPRNEGREEEEVVFVAGGVGATYVLPIYASLLMARAQAQTKTKAETQKSTERNDTDRATTKRRQHRMHFHWIVRSRAEAEWGIEHLRHTVSQLQQDLAPTNPEPLLDVTIHVTRAAEKDEADSAPEVQQLPTPPGDILENPQEIVTRPSIPFSPKTEAAAYNPAAASPLPTGIHLLTPGTRPHFPTLVNSIFSPAQQQQSQPQPHQPPSPSPSPQSPPQRDLLQHLTTGPLLPAAQLNKHHNRKTTFLVCAPTSLITDLRAEVGHHVLGQGRNVVWHEERFGMGV